MQTDYLKKAFLELGLEDFDLKLFQLVEENPDINISNLARKLGTNRLRVYSSLKGLKDKFLVTSYSVGKIKLASKYRLYSILESKQTEIESITKGLLKMVKASQDSEKLFEVELFKSKTGFQEVMNYILNQEVKNKYFLGGVEKFWDIVGWDYHLYWSEKRAKAGMNSKTLVFQNYYFANLETKHSDQKRQVKYLPERFKSLGSFVVFGEEIILFDTVEIVAYKIYNPILADLFKNLFEMIWSIV